MLPIALSAIRSEVKGSVSRTLRSSPPTQKVGMLESPISAPFANKLIYLSTAHDGGTGAKSKAISMWAEGGRGCVICSTVMLL